MQIDVVLDLLHQLLLSRGLSCRFGVTFGRNLPL